MERQSNFELLRIILIIFVAILHYNSGVAFSFINEASFTSKAFLYGIESFSLCAVNTFVCLSGFFLSNKSKISIRKIIHLFLVLFVFRILFYIPNSIVHHNFQIKEVILCFFPNNYYANLYSVVFLLSPFLNLITNNLTPKRNKAFLILLISLFSILPTITDYIYPTLFNGNQPSSISAISKFGNGQGFTLINFILLYYIGSYIARMKYKSINKPLFIYLFSSLSIFILMFINRPAVISYCNIFVILQAASLIILFSNINLQSKAVNFIAKSVWGIYVIHISFIEIYCKYFQFNINDTLLSLSMHFSICIISVFICSLLWDKLCTIILKPIELLFNKIRLFNRLISVKE